MQTPQCKRKDGIDQLLDVDIGLARGQVGGPCGPDAFVIVCELIMIQLLVFDVEEERMQNQYLLFNTCTVKKW